MSEHIIDVTDGFIESYGQFSKGEIVRCGDCKYGINDGELCAEVNKLAAERERYRALFGKALDFADEIIALGMEIDEGMA